MQSALPYLLISAYFLTLAVGILKVSPFFARSIESDSARYLSLDGLRGFLALGVFFHHAVIAYYEQKTGIWQIPPSRFYTLTGQVGVSLFFIITGFLFWEKAIVSKGKFNLIRFYISRLRRLTPAYLFSIAMVLMAMALPFGNHSLHELIWRDVVSIVTFKGIHTTGINNAYWSLPWEWKFYLILPFIAPAVRGYWSLLPAAAITYLARQNGGELAFLFNFVSGGAAAVFVRRWKIRQHVSVNALNIVAVAALGLLFFRFDIGYGTKASLLMLIFFICIVEGGDLFGLLHSRPAILLGAISYSIYVLHCTVIYIVIRGTNLFLPVAEMSAVQYWLLAAVQGTAAIALSLFSYRFFEYPFLRHPPVSGKLEIQLIQALEMKLGRRELTGNPPAPRD